jgi:hypothetical protein
MPRRRIYILNYQDYLHDTAPAPRPRLRPALRLLAFAAAIIGNGILLVRLIQILFPSDNYSIAISTTIGYVLIILLFISLAKRLNHP